MKNLILRHFAHSHLHLHLPDPLRTVIALFAELAKELDFTLPDDPEKSAGMRKLLEAKDCFVRAALDMPKEPPGDDIPF